MSQTATKEPNQEFEKEVLMCGYAPDDYKDTVRKWAEELTEIDLTSQETATNENHYLTVDFDWGNDEFELSSTLNKDELEKLQDDVKNNTYVGFRREVINRDVFVNSLHSAQNKLLRELWNQLPDTITGGYEKDFYHSGKIKTSYWEFEDDESVDKVISCLSKGIEKRRILKKEADREPGSMYETINEVPSFQFKIKMITSNEDYIDAWTEEVIVNLHKLLSKYDMIAKVRYTSCEESVTREGECFNF